MNPYAEHNVIRAPSLKRGKNDEGLNNRIKLKKILGLTVCSNAGLDVSSTTGVLAYPAGCTVVLFNSKKLTQSFLLNTAKKAITAVAYSQCGRYLATGECGHNPSIKVWELDVNGNASYENGAAGSIVAEFSGHKYAVSCVAFSPTGKYLVSVGSQHDNIVNVFDWKANLKIASNKVSAKVVAVSFSEDGNYFVTVGNRHVKYWYLEGSRKYKEPIPLMGRSAILGELRNNDFCAVSCGKGEMADSTYAITRNGHLVEFNARRLLDKWVMCRTNVANCMVTSTKYILVGCAEAIVRVFNAETLEYITTLPRTHFLGVDVAQGIHINHMMAAPQHAKYPDTIAIVYDENRSKVTCVYNDHSLYIWDLRDIRRVGKSHSFLYHSACIWGVETVPFSYLKHNISDTLPSDSFLTCSSDDTIRVWDIDNCESNELYRKNIYSKELMKVIYIDEELNFIKDMDNPIHNTEKNSSYDGRNGVRCIKIDPDNSQLATGDRSGNIRIYNLSNLKLITTIEAHDSEVLCLEYTNEKIERKLLASASRDRLIHIFDCKAGYRILQTLDDHSSSITSVRFIGTGKQFQMVSCGADKSIIFRNFQNNVFLRGNNCSGKNTLYDMEVDSNYKHILTACQDRNIRVYSTQNAKHTKTFKGSHSDDGSLIKVSLDLSGIYIATSCTDKTLSVYDYYSNECMARMYGHSELVTGLKFTNDCKHLISASGDGCVFIWQVPHDMIVTMQARLSQQALRSGHQPIPRPVSSSFADAIMDHHQPNNEQFGSPPNNLFIEDAPVTPGYRFSDVGQLPQWAKRKPSEEQSNSPVLGSSPSQSQTFGGPPKPRGRWGQKGQFDEALDLRNIVDSPMNTTYSAEKASLHHANNNNTPTSGYNSGSSKDVYSNAYLSEDSSIDSGRENRRDITFLHKKISETKAMNSLNSESNTEHDGDVEDISDGERTSSEHGMVYYPTVAPSTPTDFKINEIDVNELRKSIRRQKLEKQGLSIAAQLQMQSAASTGTGTGTSDDEDEGSTPSGDNADRSLASTLGGSSESIPQQTSSTFLQAALDGPAGVSDKERVPSSRKSISAMHNNDSKITTSISKSYANNKKEELMKVINEAKAKLENGILIHSKRDVKYSLSLAHSKVGYRSGLRASQSISDLSHAMGSGGPGSGNRMQRIGDSSYSYRDYPPVPPPPATTGGICNYLNCAAPRSRLAQNCAMMNQIQQELPPYPKNLGIYGKPNKFESEGEAPVVRPDKLELPELPPVPADKLRKHPGILKNYKSCPVSPVHEEQEWSLVPNADDTGKLEPEGGPSHRTHHHHPARHSMYYEDAKTILDMIHSDTERMIKEITSKYGDLDDLDASKPKSVEPQPSICSNDRNTPKPLEVVNKTLEGLKTTARKEKHEHSFLSEDDPNFSSDSLEDCSLDLDIGKTDQGRSKRNLCAKHQKPSQPIDSLPKRSASDYSMYLYDSFQPGPYRNVSLSDILDEDKRSADNRFLETQRHSSASFFLGQQYPDRKSQESILSDDFGSGGVSYCNSMESILSDDSECKSAPLEVLFGRIKRDRNCSANYEYKIEANCNSKSYGSSPNACSGFDYYMQNNYFNRDAPESYAVDNLDAPYRIAEARSPQHKRVSVPGMPTSISYPRFISNSALAEAASTEDHVSNEEDFIPSLTAKVAQYGGATVKSLSKDFANQRKQMNSNPLYNCEGNELFLRKTVNATNQITRSDIFGNESSVYVMKKSCSFEIEMGGRRIGRNSKKFEQNLQRFEQERQQQSDRYQFGGTMEMDYVPHKPPVAHRRSASMKGRGRVRSKEKFNTIIGQMSASTYEDNRLRDFVNKDYMSKEVMSVASCSKVRPKDADDEKSFEIYVAEKGVCEDDNMDSLELLAKPDLHKQNSVDSLDDTAQHSQQQPPIKDRTELEKLIDFGLMSATEYNRFLDIEKKIDIINKLVEMEERKLEQERVAKANRMKPFECNSRQKGYVKSLTENFDKLAKDAQEELENEKSWHLAVQAKMKRNFSLPDVLEGAKFQSFSFGDSEDLFKQKDEDELSEKDEHSLGYMDGEGGNPRSLISAQDSDESSIRRACSLSDLSMGKATSYKPVPSARVTVQQRSAPKRSTSSVGKGGASLSSGMGLRSVSVGTLNQASDSEPEPPSTRGGLLKPTISSQNKVNGTTTTNNGGKYVNPRSAAGIINRRKGLQSAYSSVNIASAAQDESSSEESPTSTVSTVPAKPAVPPRPRSIAAMEHKRIVNVGGGLNAKKVHSTNMEMESMIKDGDLDNADLTNQLCSNIINQLVQTTSSVIQLHQRLKSNDESGGGSGRNNSLMIKELENAVIMTQNMLTKVTNRNIGGDSINLNNSTSMYEKCNDILNQVQKHVNNSG
ncbi:uncharacterized protein LOC129775144 isoform X2 [Toxorhynchites rutilus septentrionalis]|uniref:uncharacterized protein LOC129775144 isoform X2 n=1 Tax=Toxorhynchites rutilus septentrionalis TaxID=329112 RepID=UPI002478D64C|nr:uncharacterized protein LOC129775144 isoform X2 [Toxorhynchites rutilus septentrionalis]XP_055635459.1 uncharacterized protein LOC129775144 isoform X2 [Toxorhynchites rutilus septentrionalis]